MPSKGGYPFKAIRSPGIFVVAGRFTTAGAAAPTVIQGTGFTIAAPVGAAYTVTLTDGAFAGCIYADAKVITNTANSTAGARIGNIAAASGTFTIFTSSSSGTDAQLTGPDVAFVLFLRDTTATK